MLRTIQTRLIQEAYAFNELAQEDLAASDNLHQIIEAFASLTETFTHLMRVSIIDPPKPLEYGASEPAPEGENNGVCIHG